LIHLNQNFSTSRTGPGLQYEIRHKHNTKRAEHKLTLVVYKHQTYSRQTLIKVVNKDLKTKRINKSIQRINSN